MKKRILLIFISFLSISLSAKYSKEDLYNIMLVSSPSIKQSRLNVKSAYNNFKSYEGKLYPKIDYALSGTYIANPLAAIDISYSQLPMPMVPGAGAAGAGADQQSFINVYPGMESTNYSGALRLVQPLSIFGKIFNAVDITKETYRSALWSANIQRNADKNTLYCSCDMISCIDTMEEELAIADEAADELIKLSTSSYEGGMITYSKNTEAATSAYKIKSAYQNILAQKENNLENIKTLTGNYDLTLEDIDYSDVDLTKYLAILDVPKEDLVSKATSPKKDIMRLRKSAEKIAIDTKKIRSSSMGYTPDIYLYASLSYTTPRFPIFETDWYGKGRWQGSVGISMSGTIFDGFSQFRDRDAASNKVDSEKQQTLSTIRGIEDTITRLLSCIRVCNAEINHKMAQKREKDLMFLEVGTKYSEGSSSKIDYLTTLIEKTVSNVELNNEYMKLIAYYYALVALVEES